MIGKPAERRQGRQAKGWGAAPYAALPQGATATLGIYVDCGSVYETPANTGAAPRGRGDSRLPAAWAAGSTGIGQLAGVAAARCCCLRAHARYGACLPVRRRVSPAGVHGLQDHQEPHPPAPGARGGVHWRQRAGLGCAAAAAGSCAVGGFAGSRRQSGGACRADCWESQRLLPPAQAVAATGCSTAQQAVPAAGGAAATGRQPAMISIPPSWRPSCALPCSLPRADGVQHRHQQGHHPRGAGGADRRGAQPQVPVLGGGGAGGARLSGRPAAPQLLLRRCALLLSAGHKQRLAPATCGQGPQPRR